MLIVSEIIVHTGIFLAVMWGIAAVSQIVCAGLHAYDDEPFMAIVCSILAALNILLCIAYAAETETQYIVNVSSETSIVEFNETYEIIEQLDEDTYQVRLKETTNESTDN